MHRFPAMLAAIALFVAAPVFAASPQAWPWKSKAPPDPALAALSHIEGVTAASRRGHRLNLGKGDGAGARLHGAAASITHGRS